METKETLRDRIAIKAMQILEKPKFFVGEKETKENHTLFAKSCYQIADAMLEERERTQEKESDKRYLKTPLIPKGGVLKCVIPCNEEMQMNGRCPCLKDSNSIDKPEFPKDRNINARNLEQFKPLKDHLENISKSFEDLIKTIDNETLIINKKIKDFFNK